MPYIKEISMMMMMMMMMMIVMMMMMMMIIIIITIMPLFACIIISFRQIGLLVTMEFYTTRDFWKCLMQETPFGV